MAALFISTVRRSAVVAVASVATCWLGRPMLATLTGRHAEPTDPAAALDALTGCVAGAIAVGCLLWLWTAVVAAALATVPGAVGRCSATVSVRITPVLLRRVVTGLVGVVVVAGPASPAFAAQSTSPSGSTPATATVAPAVPGAGAAALRDLPLPERPSATSTPDPATTVRASGVQAQAATTRQVPPGQMAARHTASHGASEVVVHRGDTLWDIAGRHLGPGASAAEVAAAWPRWWRANVDVIGADPDLLRPGQILTPPR